METGAGKEEILDEFKRKKMMRRKKKLVTRLGFFYPHQACFIYKHALMGLYESTVQHIITGSYMLLNADDKRKVNVSRKKMRTKKRREERAGDKQISIKNTSSPRP
jgi:hypothetical protein